MKNPFKLFSLQVTLFTSFIMISAILIALLGITSYYTTNQEVVNKTISSRILLLDEINKQIDFQLQTIEYDSLAVASNPTVRSFLEEQEFSFERIEQNPDIIDLLSRHSYIKEAIHSVQIFAKNSTSSSYIGANGVFAYSIIEKSPSYSYIEQSDSGWLGSHLIEIGNYISINDNVVSFYRKVFSPSGHEIGVLIFNMKLSYMYDLISGDKADSNRYIFDSNLRLIVEAAGKDTASVSFAALENDLDQVMNKAESQSNYAIETFDTKKLLIWNKQARTQWIAMDMIPWESITQGSKRIQTTIIFTVIICVVLAVVFAYILSKQFVTPIKSLVRVMALLKTGKMKSRVNNDYDNEFGYLNHHFNSMAEEIEDLINQLQEQNQKKREAEIKVLQEQMNPHFLYNTLDMMNWQAIAIGADDISRMLSLLGKMLRIGLSSGATFIPLSKETEHLECYVELQKIRHQHNISFELEMPVALHDYYVPKLILQPFVENSIIHGFHSRRAGTIWITGSIEGERLHFSVKDDGHGITEGKDIYSSNHHGVRNVKERIDLYFGPQYGIEIDSMPNKGTTISISLPLITIHSVEMLHQKGGSSQHD
ncbi:MAG TPA: sensor histidine kinase [Candidatus Paenibacillus intestinavium]|nr:sensor histidine kinase [Candidatus Paenibacillus intestinavium]